MTTAIDQLEALTAVVDGWIDQVLVSAGQLVRRSTRNGLIGRSTSLSLPTRTVQVVRAGR